MAMLSPHKPYFIRHSRGVRAKRYIVPLRVNNPAPLLLFLAEDVTKNAAFFLFEPRHCRPKFVENPAGDKGGCCYLRMRVFPFGPGQFASVFEYSNVLEP